MNNISNTDKAIMTLFNCGLYDLSIINDSGVDMYDYLDYVVDRDSISLNNFVEYIVEQANEALLDAWETDKEEIMDKISEMKKEIIEECGEDYFKEYPNDDEVRLIDFYENKADEIIHKGFSVYFNYLDTHISIPYADLLEELFLLDRPLEIIGFTGIEEGIE